MLNAWTYEKAGVPHLKGDPAYNRQISRLIKSTLTPEVRRATEGAHRLGFASLFDLKKINVRDPLLVSSTDGVGTKLEIARLQGRHDTIGIDLVAMSVNDLLTMGARPLFFLDYFATGKFEPNVTKDVLTGIVKGCRLAGCALVGGETAVMPGFYSAAENGSAQYDLAGFAVGVVDRKKIITGKRIKKGDVLLGLASSGFHSNGYSLLRKLFSEDDLRGKLGRELLTPTRIYVRPVLKLIASVPVHGIVNITGGGFIDNLPRVTPKGLGAILFKGSWPRPKLFDLVQDSGSISNFEMMRTFNLGIGMVVVLPKESVKKAQKVLSAMKLDSWVIGEICRGRAVEVL